jgi:hypothetical protein
MSDTEQRKIVLEGSIYLLHVDPCACSRQQLTMLEQACEEGIYSDRLPFADLSSCRRA